MSSKANRAKLSYEESVKIMEETTRRVGYLRGPGGKTRLYQEVADEVNKVFKNNRKAKSIMRHLKKLFEKGKKLHEKMKTKTTGTTDDLLGQCRGQRRRRAQCAMAQCLAHSPSQTGQMTPALLQGSVEERRGHPR